MFLGKGMIYVFLKPYLQFIYLKLKSVNYKIEVKNDILRFVTCNILLLLKIKFKELTK